MKKIICLMMVLLMAISALSGCQTKEKSSTPDEGSFEATQDEAVDVATQDEAVAVATPNEVAENDDFIAPETVDVKELMADLPELNAEGFVSNYFNSSMLYYNGLLYDGRKIYDGKGNDKMYSDEHARRIAINNSVIIYALTDKDREESEIWAVLSDCSRRAKLTLAKGYAAPLFIEHGLLYYTEGVSQKSINTLDLNTGEITQIVPNGNVIMNIGKKVYFNTKLDGTDDVALCCYNLDTKEQKEICRITGSNIVRVDHDVMYFESNNTVYRLDPQTDSPEEYVKIPEEAWFHIIVNGTVVYEEAADFDDHSLWAVSDTQPAHKLLDTRKSHFDYKIGDAYILNANVMEVGIINYYYDGTELKERPEVEGDEEHRLVCADDGKFFYRDGKTILMSTEYVDEDIISHKK
jgi:hypothetical protein